MQGTESYVNLASSPLPASSMSDDWARASELDWEMASNGTAGETGPGGHNLVPPGVVGAEYRLMKEALEKEAECDPYHTPRGTSTPQRDPYHGRCADPKCVSPHNPGRITDNNKNACSRSLSLNPLCTGPFASRRASRST